MGCSTMNRPALVAKTLTIIAALLALCCGIHSDAAPRLPRRMITLPRLTLWAWERREDLSHLDSGRLAVAYLDQTLTFGLNVHAQPRRDPVIFPASATRIPVVRLEAGSNVVLDDMARGQAVRAILSSAKQPAIAALQIDFDATRSQRDFYRALLIDLRRQMPPDLPLSITALASWCSYDDWLRGLPIDEAVPMFFRMEPDRRRAPASLAEFRIREPLCQSSVGISTTEAWPQGIDGKRIYLFPDNGWRVDSIARFERKLP
jgi:hypothetical protein